MEPSICSSPGTRLLHKGYNRGFSLALVPALLLSLATLLLPKPQSGPGSSRARDFSRVLSSKLVPVPHPWRDALRMSGTKHLSGEGRMLPVQTASAGLNAGQGMDLLPAVATTSREKW